MAELGLYPGTPVVIERIGSSRYIEEKFLGRIETVDVSRLRIILPAAFVQLLPLTIGEEIQLKASLPEGMYRFDGRILETSPTGFTMPYPFNTTRLQRREQRRIRADGIVVFAVRETHGRPTFGTILDISIGGMQIQTEKWLPTGANLQIEFSLTDQLRGASGGIIRWKKDAKANSGQGRTFCYGVRFVDLDEQIKRQIANFIRDYERSMLSAMTDTSLPAPGK